MTVGDTYPSLMVGDSISGRFSVVTWHIMTGSSLYNDFGPNHVDIEHAKEGRFGAPIAHGFTTTGQMMGVLGRHLVWSIVAFLGSHIEFTGPVYESENVDVTWVVIAKKDKAAFSGGIVELEGTAWAGQERRQAVSMNAKLAVNDYSGPSTSRR